MVSRLAPAVALMTLFAVPCLGAEAPQAVQLEAVDPSAGGEWSGGQIVRADRVGNVYYFRVSALEVVPLTRAGKLGDAQRLEVTGQDPQIVRDASLGPRGDTWLVSADLGVRLFVDGKERAVPALDWRPSGIGFLRGEPVVATLPFPVASDQAVRERKGPVPRLVAFDGNRWNTLSVFPDLEAEVVLNQRPDLNSSLAGFASLLTSDPEGHLWVARQYAYDIEQLSSAGKRRLRLVVDGGRVIEKKEQEARASHPAGLHAFRANAAILDLVEGSDHRVYFLVAAGAGDEGLSLDRFDPSSGRLERIALAFKRSGRFTMASGRNGLYLAPWNAQEGRWLLPWEAIELAKWSPVATAEIDPVQPSDRLK